MLKAKTKEQAINKRHRWRANQYRRKYEDGRITFRRCVEILKQQYRAVLRVYRFTNPIDVLADQYTIFGGVVQKIASIEILLGVNNRSKFKPKPITADQACEYILELARKHRCSNAAKLCEYSDNYFDHSVVVDALQIAGLYV